MVCDNPRDKSSCSVQWIETPISTVSDDYAVAKPTYIINYADTYDPVADIIPNPTTPVLNTFVSIGYFRATTAEDGLFEGRQEYNILRPLFDVSVVNGQLVMNGASKKPDIRVWFRRKKLRKMKNTNDINNADAFIPVATAWDTNWQPHEVSKKFVLYSWDRGKIADSVAFSFTYDLGPLGGRDTISANLKFSIPGGSPSIIYQDDWYRANYYRLAKTANPVYPSSLNAGIKGGWRVWGLGSNYSATTYYE